jgi:hypothetical protein
VWLGCNKILGDENRANLGILGRHIHLNLRRIVSKLSELQIKPSKLTQQNSHQWRL